MPFLAGDGKHFIHWPCVILQHVHCEQPETLAVEHSFTLWSRCRLIFRSVWVFIRLAGTWSKGKYFLAQLIKCVLGESYIFTSTRLLGFFWHAIIIIIIFPRSASGAVAAANLISQIQQGKIKLNQGLKLSKAGNLYLYLGNSQFTDASEEQRVISRWHMQSY